MIRLAAALFALQGGFHGFTATLPIALSRQGVSDADIGVVVGAAAIVQVPPAIAMGLLIDRFGGVRLLLACGVAYLLAGVAIVIGSSADDAFWLVLGGRVLQGIGHGAALPAALSLVPGLVRPTHVGRGLATVSTAYSLTIVTMPPISLAVLDVASLTGVAIAVVISVALGLLLLAIGPVTHGGHAPRIAPIEWRAPWRRLRSAWITPLAIAVLFVPHWGVITAYLPQRAARADADIGLFFIADGLAVVALKITMRSLADTARPVLVVTAALATIALALALLILPPSTPVLVMAGILTGTGAGLLSIPLITELSLRSSEGERGTAFSFHSAAMACGIALGSVGLAPVVQFAGFEAAIVATLGGLAVAAWVGLSDHRMATAPASRAVVAEPMTHIENR